MAFTKTVKIEVEDEEDARGGFQVHFGPSEKLRVTGPNGYAAPEISVRMVPKLIEAIQSMIGGSGAK